MLCDQEWRCKKCRKLLGVWKGRRLEIRLAKGQEYLAAAPVTTNCKCGVLNEFIGMACGSPSIQR